MYIFLSGEENIGWSLDHDRKYILRALNSAGYKTTNLPWRGKIIHSLCWNSFDSLRYKYFPFYTKILLTCSNFIDPCTLSFSLHKKFTEAKKLASLWVAPSTQQKLILEKEGLNSIVIPFFINFELFKSEILENKERICYKLGIPYEIIKDKIILGSFQRDSLGSNLNKPKWQKNPQGLIYLLSQMPKDKFILLLAGPRRHYILEQCKKNRIPHYFIGKMFTEDDISKNIIDISIMPFLYKLIDLYLITSVSEGGPKAVLEASAANTLCLSTPVGLAQDYLHPATIFSDFNSYGSTLYKILTDNITWRTTVIRYAHQKCMESQTFAMQKKLIDFLYKETIKL